MTEQSALARELNQLIMSGLEDRRATITSLPASIIEYDAGSESWRVTQSGQSLAGSEGQNVPLAATELLVFRGSEDIARALPQLVKPPKPVTAVTIAVRLQPGPEFAESGQRTEGLLLSTRSARAENGVEALRDAILLADAEIEDALFKGFRLTIEVRES